MQATTAVGTGSRGGKLAAALVLAAGILAGAAGGAAAAANVRQIEPPDGCGGTASARIARPLLDWRVPAPVGVMRGAHYVGFLPE